jgi:hypothetical protein
MLECDASSAKMRTLTPFAAKLVINVRLPYGCPLGSTHKAGIRMA